MAQKWKAWKRRKRRRKRKRKRKRRKTIRKGGLGPGDSSW